MKLTIKRITTDSGLVLGSYDSERDRYRSVDRPSALMHFIKTVIHDVFRPRADHQCTPACAEVVTLVLGAPHYDDLAASAPP